MNWIQSLLSNRLNKSFKGLLVEVMTTSSITTSNNNDTSYISKPYIIQGYLLDSDENFVYMGDNKKEIRFSINKTSIVAIDRINEEPVVHQKSKSQDDKQLTTKDLPEGTFYVDNRSKTNH